MRAVHSLPIFSAKPSALSAPRRFDFAKRQTTSRKKKQILKPIKTWSGTLHRRPGARCSSYLMRPLLHPLPNNQSLFPSAKSSARSAPRRFDFAKRQKKLDQMRSLHFLPQGISFARTFWKKVPAYESASSFSYTSMFNVGCSMFDVHLLLRTLAVNLSSRNRRCGPHRPTGKRDKTSRSKIQEKKPDLHLSLRCSPHNP